MKKNSRLFYQNVKKPDFEWLFFRKVRTDPLFGTFFAGNFPLPHLPLSQNVKYQIFRHCETNFPTRIMILPSALPNFSGDKFFPTQKAVGSETKIFDKKGWYLPCTCQKLSKRSSEGFPDTLFTQTPFCGYAPIPKNFRDTPCAKSRNSERQISTS